MRAQLFILTFFYNKDTETQQNKTKNKFSMLKEKERQLIKQ